MRARSELTKGPGSGRQDRRSIYKLLEAVEARWRKLTGAHLVERVRAEARFINGEWVDRDKEQNEDTL